MRSLRRFYGEMHLHSSVCKCLGKAATFKGRFNSLGLKAAMNIKRNKRCQELGAPSPASVIMKSLLTRLLPLSTIARSDEITSLAKSFPFSSGSTLQSSNSMRLNLFFISCFLTMFLSRNCFAAGADFQILFYEKLMPDWRKWRKFISFCILLSFSI